MSKRNRDKRINSKQIQNSNDQNPNPKLPIPKPLLLVLLIIIVATIVTYWNSLEGEFHFDDYPKIVENPDIRNLRGVFVDGPKRSEPRMVSNFTLYLNYKFDGYNVRYYHAFNIGLHVINCILIYFVVMLMLRRVGIDKRYLAFLVSLFFALHPINTEPLNYIVHGRFIILCMMFYLLGILFFILAFETRRRKWLYLTLCFISYILSVFSKEVGITLPGVLFFYYLYFICDSKKAFLRALALFGVAMVIVVVYALWYGLPGIIKTRIPEGVSVINGLLIEILTQLNVAVTYLKLYLLPLPSLLNVDHVIYTIPHSDDYTPHLDTETAFSIAIILGLLLLTVITYKYNRLISFSLLFLFITHSPTTLTRKGEIIAEYRNYLPIFGFCFLVALVLDKVFSYVKKSKLYTIAIALVIAVFLSAFCYIRNEVWLNEFTLWGDAVSKPPVSARAYNNLGLAYDGKKDYDKAIECYMKSIETSPSYTQAMNNLSVSYFQKGNLDEAGKWAKKVLEYERSPEGYVLLGLISFTKNDDAGCYNYFKNAPDRALRAVGKVVYNLEPSQKNRMQTIIQRLKDIPK